MRRLLFAITATFALVGLLAMACSSSSDEAAPTRPPISNNDDASAAVDTGVDAFVDPGCVGDAGCFKCAPVTNEQFLNECTDGLCTPFDNAARLPLYKVGQPLPPVP